MASAIVFGLKPTIIITLALQFPLNLLLCLLFQINIKLTLLSPAGLFGSGAILLFGGVFGYARDLSIKRQQELKRRKEAEDKLQEYRTQLESMVDEKTAELAGKVAQLESQERERIRLTQIIEQANELIMIMDV
jgi:hypothetical protein